MRPPQPTAEYLDVDGCQLHYRRVRPDLGGFPLLFLHEGLGSVDLWRRFPEGVVDRSGHPGLVYSRYGNGWSTALVEPRKPDYMHHEALETLPRVVESLLDGPPVLIGHSDGASIAIIHAGAGHVVKGLVLIAPHVFVEPESVGAIAGIAADFDDSDLVDRMAKYHRDAETTFRGWADVWLSPAFRAWNIEGYVASLGCPTLLVQGDADQYGTEAQLEAIESGMGSPVRRLMVPGAGHSPHLTHPGLVTDAVVDFIGGLS